MPPHLAEAIERFRVHEGLTTESAAVRVLIEVGMSAMARGSITLKDIDGALASLQ